MSILNIFRNKKKKLPDLQDQEHPLVAHVRNLKNIPESDYVRDLPFDIELGDVVDLEDGSPWCVMAIDHNKQEYRLEGVSIRDNRGKTMTIPITELYNTAKYRFRFPTNGTDRESEPGVEKAIKEKQELPPLTLDLFGK